MIDDFGWSPALGQAFAPYAARGFIPGRVAIQQRGSFHVITEHGELRAGLAGRLVHAVPEGGHPVVGDWVAVAARPTEGTATIQDVLPRRTLFTRQAAGGRHAQAIAANIDIALLVSSINDDLNPRRLERYLAAAWARGARPVLVLTKTDLCADPAAWIAAAEAIAFGVDVLAVSAVSGSGMAEFARLLRPGETCVLAGSSGVGKSTLVNALAGADIMATGGIREDDAKGRHTTTHRELIRLPGGALLLDTPGMRAFGLIDAQDGLGVAFDDIEALAGACRFRDCSHTTEPGCEIIAALEAGSLDAGRLKNFQKLQRELDRAARREDPIARAAVHRQRVVLARAQRAGKKHRGKG
jgi:ribosome biogenesis GTPase